MFELVFKNDVLLDFSAVEILEVWSKIGSTEELHSLFLLFRKALKKNGRDEHRDFQCE